MADYAPVDLTAEGQVEFELNGRRVTAPAGTMLVDAAFAHGVPVVTTEPPDGAEDAVLAVPKRDSEALSSHLARLARDPALRERLVAVGRAWVSERRSARPPGGLSALYRSLLERGR